MPTNDSASDGCIDNEETTERVVCPVCDGQSDGFDECEFCGYVFAGEDGDLGDAQTGP